MTAVDLHGKTAIVTGASRGIGLAAAQALATAGANVVLTSRKQESADEAAAQELAAAIALNRIGESDDVAAAIVFLASDAASWITGETMVIDGGLRLGNAVPYRRGVHADV
jgi:NAD(P)-dependent dehydrogenase (short-subunit alcohol dehydrogenase family)